MRSVSIRQLDMKQATIPLGFEGENDFTEVRIDCKKTFDQHPNAVPSMTVTDPAGNKYPAVVTRDGDVVVWQLTAGDLTTKGYGEIQIEFIIDGTVIGKTDIARTRIERSIFPEGEAPEPVQNWLDEANQTLSEVEEAKQAFPAGGTTGQVLTKKSDEDYDTEWKTPQGGGGGTSNYNDLDNKPSINGVTLSGNKSLSDLSIPSQGDVNAKYTKPQGGIPASDIDPSAIPSPTSIIDDNAGEGDTNKVLSADKVTEITDGLKEAITQLNVSIPVGTVQSGGYVNNKGENAASNSYSRTDFVPYVYNTKALLAINCTVYDTVSFVFYDKDQRVIQIITGANASQFGITPSRSVQRINFEVPEGTAYFRASYLGSASSNSFDAKTNYIGESASIRNALYDLATGKTGEYLTYTGTSKKIINNQGVVSDTTDSSYYVTNNIAILPDTYYMITASSGYSNGFYTILDEDQNVIQFEKSPSTGGNVLDNKLIFTPKNAAYIVVGYISSVCNARIFKCNELMPDTVKPFKAREDFLNISYSTLDIAAINTVETYLSAGHFGFNACKGDVRPTSDGKLVMCHDAGFTFDGNGRITTYNSSSNTPIHNLTYAECMAKEYASKSGSGQMNHYAKVADIDQFLEVCKEYNMTAFITIREEYISTVIAEVLAALKRHAMTDHCIINSYSMDALLAIREITKDIPVSMVMGTERTLIKRDINDVWVLGNSIVTLVSSAENMRTYLTAQSARIEDAIDKGVGLMFAQPLTLEDVNYIRNLGFCGAQIGRTVLPYRMSQLMFKVSISSSTPTISEWNGLSTFDATISASGNVISVSAFCEDGSVRGFPDKIMDLWMNQYPHRITAVSEGGYSVTAAWQNNALNLTVADISVNDTIDVIIEV